jgi:hypothetical protein
MASLQLKQEEVPEEETEEELEELEEVEVRLILDHLLLQESLDRLRRDLQDLQEYLVRLGYPGLGPQLHQLHLDLQADLDRQGDPGSLP